MPIRSQIGTEGETFASHLIAVRNRIFGAHDHGEYPFARLVRALNPPRDLSRGRWSTSSSISTRIWSSPGPAAWRSPALLGRPRRQARPRRPRPGARGGAAARPRIQHPTSSTPARCIASWVISAPCWKGLPPIPTALSQPCRSSPKPSAGNLVGMGVRAAADAVPDLVAAVEAVAAEQPAALAVRGCPGPRRPLLRRAVGSRLASGASPPLARRRAGGRGWRSASTARRRC